MAKYQLPCFMSTFEIASEKSLKNIRKSDFCYNRETDIASWNNINNAWSDSSTVSKGKVDDSKSDD